MDYLFGHGMIAPVLALIAWTFVMWLWLYAARIPAMRKARIDLEDVRQGRPVNPLPARVTRVADNYNHLHEQPTLFYALALAAQLAGAVDQISLILAWSYVAIRIVHSLIHAGANIIPIRFLVFTIGSLALLALLLRTAALVFGWPLPI
jgi:hypothetical protein